MLSRFRKIPEVIKSSIKILLNAIRHFSKDRGAESAASMAYYSLFSIFPLILVLIAFSSRFLEEQVTQDQVLTYILNIIPFNQDLIRANLSQVIRLNNSVSVLGLIGLAWAATGVFSVLIRYINRAWPDAGQRNFIASRLMAFGIVAGITVVLSVLVLLNTITSLIPQVIKHAALEALSKSYYSRVLIWFLLFITLTFLYYWVPNIKVRWKEAAAGGIISATAADIATAIFSWFIGSGLARYNIVYGSVGAIVALLFWIYLLNVIILVGAHLSSEFSYFSKKASNISQPEISS